MFIEKSFLFAIIMWSSTGFMISSINPVYAVLFLIFVFFNASLLLIFFKIDFLGLIFLMIYVGAVAVLFLFVVMMLNIKKLQRDNTTYFTIGSIISIILFFQLLLFIIDGSVYADLNRLMLIHYKEWFFSYMIEQNETHINFVHIGLIMYDHFFIYLLYCGLILLTAIIAAIFLTNKRKSNFVIFIKEQNVYKQNSQLNKVKLVF